MNNSIPQNFNNFDIIGDIHGHSNDLKKLLSALGYSIKNNTYQHPERKVLFLGDYIDRGVNVVEVLEIVKNMVESGNAIALMGNHEYNAICYNTLSSQGTYLREHSKKNFNQHAITMAAFMQYPQLYKMYIDWFKTLPLFYENDSFRAVHACWDTENIEYLKSQLTNNCLTTDLLEESSLEGTELHKAVYETLKGKEITLPKNQTFIDKDGVLRTEFRIKWWQIPAESTYQAISALPIRDLPADDFDSSKINFYSKEDKPVFFGHYWMKLQANQRARILSENSCCLDYSVAKEGSLVCYRYSGEQKLDSKQINYIK
ncbi:MULTISPECIES: metallophosphoesterase [Myroides]|uniref:Phosphoesterase n=1 Tax=Myroides albus TaxID=2562892 RepID=A0A6I3LLK8_9FLAO|nr:MULTISPECIES: metallophosphoesterase [Myroides]MTG98396.1 phosphoesterase [Myroides albus]MVX36634.1 phosphoesterase [Myroides sp. LoEW2-1]UVD79693.1 metallophosphoesterase [Myroides albus]